MTPRHARMSGMGSRLALVASLLLLASGSAFCLEETTGKAKRAGAEKTERKPLKKPPKDKESKYISPGKEVGGAYRFDEHGRPLKGSSDEKEAAQEDAKDKPKKAKWPRKPGKRRPGTKPKKEKPAQAEPAEESGEETSPSGSEGERSSGTTETPPEAESPAEPETREPSPAEEPPPESPPSEDNPE